MNKISMDALNRGWAVGLGTEVHPHDPDFEEALTREQAAPRPGRRSAPARIDFDIAARIETVFNLLQRRLARP